MREQLQDAKVSPMSIIMAETELGPAHTAGCDRVYEEHNIGTDDS